MPTDTTNKAVDHIADDRPNIYPEPESNKVVLRASSIGNCTRSLAALMLGHDPAPTPARLQKAFDEGNANEPVILNLLRTRELGQEDRHGVKASVVWKALDDYDIESQGFGQMVGGQLEVEVHGVVDGDGNRWVVRGHTDGVAQVFKMQTGLGGECVGLELRDRAVVEAKAFAESTYRKWRQAAEAGGLEKVWEAFPYYAWQASVYSAATNLPVLFVIGVKDRDGVVQEVVTYMVGLDEMPFGRGAIKARVAKIKRMVEEGRVDVPCDAATYPCPVWYLHDEDQEVVGSDDVPDVGVLELVALGYAQARKAEAEAKKLRDEGEAIIKGWIADHPEMADKELFVNSGGERVKMKVKVKEGGEREMTEEEKEKEMAKTMEKIEKGVVKSNRSVTVTTEVVGEGE